MSDIKPTMMLVSVKIDSVETFKLIPLDGACPYVEGMYNPARKHLVLFGVQVKSNFHHVPKLDEDGVPIPLKKGTGYKMQRITLETYPEHYVEETSEIENLIKILAVNESSFDYQKFTRKSDIYIPEKPKIEVIKG